MSTLKVLVKQIVLFEENFLKQFVFQVRRRGKKGEREGLIIFPDFSNVYAVKHIKHWKKHTQVNFGTKFTNF